MTSLVAATLPRSEAPARLKRQRRTPRRPLMGLLRRRRTPRLALQRHARICRERLGELAKFVFCLQRQQPGKRQWRQFRKCVAPGGEMLPFGRRVGRVAPYHIELEAVTRTESGDSLVEAVHASASAATFAEGNVAVG